MSNYLKFDNTNSSTFGMYVANVNQFDAPERDVELIEIPGRNGSLTYDNGRFKNIERVYSMYTRNVENVNAFRAFLKSKIGYCRLEDSFDTTHYRLARYTAPFEMGESDRQNGAFELTFDCDPRRFLTSGETTITVTSGRTLTNPTYYEAKPLIRAYGTGSFTIGSVTVTISSASTYTDIDCEIMDCYKGATNCNGNVTTTDYKFPTLVSGSNTISLSGITKLVITPRWWEV